MDKIDCISINFIGNVRYKLSKDALKLIGGYVYQS